MSQECYRFRCSVRRLWAWLAGLGNLGCGLTMWVCSGGQFHLGLRVLAYVLVNAMALAVAAYTAFSNLEVTLHPGGIWCGDVWGIDQFAGWPSIEVVERWGLPGLRFLRLRGERMRRALYLPLFLHRQSEFAALVAEFAGREHPLAVKLWESVA